MKFGFKFFKSDTEKLENTKKIEQKRLKFNFWEAVFSLSSSQLYEERLENTNSIYGVQIIDSQEK